MHVSYVDVIKRIKSLMNHPKLRGKAVLILDRTGVGVAIADMFRDQGLSCKAITITAATKARQEYKKGRALDNFYVPKQDLVSVLQALMEQKKLSIAKGLKDGEALAQELKSFKAKISTIGHISYEASTSWREADLDDLVLSVALGCWFATKRPEVKIPNRNVRILRAMTSFR